MAGRIKAFRLGTDHAAADQEAERDHQRQNDERNCKTPFRTTPSLPVSNPILHRSTPSSPGLRAQVVMPAQREKNSTELWLCGDKAIVNLP
jgi:hypothetical protein